MGCKTENKDTKPTNIYLNKKQKTPEYGSTKSAQIKQKIPRTVNTKIEFSIFYSTFDQQ